MRTVHLSQKGIHCNAYAFYFVGRSAFDNHESELFCVEIDGADFEQHTWSILNPKKRYRVEVCHVGDPHWRKHYTLLSRTYVTAGELFELLGSVLVEHYAIEVGVPVTFRFSIGHVHLSVCQHNPRKNSATCFFKKTVITIKVCYTYFIRKRKSMRLGYVCQLLRRDLSTSLCCRTTAWLSG